MNIYLIVTFVGEQFLKRGYSEVIVKINFSFSIFSSILAGGWGQAGLRGLGRIKGLFTWR